MNKYRIKTVFDETLNKKLFVIEYKFLWFFWVEFGFTDYAKFCEYNPIRHALIRKDAVGFYTIDEAKEAIKAYEHYIWLLDNKDKFKTEYYAVDLDKLENE